MLVDKKKRMIRACLVPVFENTKNTILVFSENLFLFFEFSVFRVLCVFQNKKDLGSGNQMCSLCFPCPPCA